MPQPDHVSALGIPAASTLDSDLQEVFKKCVEKLGFIPNVLAAYSLRPNKLRNFMALYNELMLAPSGLSKLEREMIAVVVSSEQVPEPVAVRYSWASNPIGNLVNKEGLPASSFRTDPDSAR